MFFIYDKQHPLTLHKPPGLPKEVLPAHYHAQQLHKASQAFTCDSPTKDIGNNVTNVERQRCGGHMIDELLKDLEEIDELAGNGSSDVELLLTLAFLS